MKHAPRFFLLGIGTLCLSTISSRTLADDISAFPLTPRVSGMGLGGTDQLISGDGMAALLGNENGIWLLDAQGKTAFHSSYVGSVGTGFRMVQNDQRILGAYVFGDGNVSATNHEYWFVSPGVESMGTLMDFRMNGYIPVGTQRNLTSTGFADNFGNYNYVTFTAHDQFDAIVNNYEEVGWGLDGEAGVRLAQLKGARVYAGGYHFNIPNSDDINGVSGRIQVPITSFIEFNVRDSYDNDQHNTIEVGLRFTLGGVNKSPTDPNQPIRERLLDPIERNLATLGQGTAEPVVNEQVVVSPSVLERDNIWFFSPAGTDTFVNSSSCTAEDPCINTNFTQATIDAINAGTNSPVIVNPTPSSDPSFYLTPGQYSILTINGTTATPYTFTNDLVYGRSADFIRPEQAAFLNGAVILNGNDTFDSVIFHNNPSFTQAVGLTLNTGSTLILTNSIVGADESTQGYATAIEMQGATLNAINSQIHAFSNTQGVSAIGIHTLDSSNTINLTNSLVKATANITAASAGANFLAAAGILLDGSSGDTVNLRRTTVDATAVSTLALGAQNVFVAGIFVGPNNTAGQENINLSSNSVINVNGNFTSGNPLVMGIGTDTLDPATAQVINVTLNNSTINANLAGSSDTSAVVQGISLNATASNQVNLTNSDIKAESTANSNLGSITIEGISETGASSETVRLNNSQVDAIITSGTAHVDNAIGIEVIGGGANSQATIDLSGSKVSAVIPNSQAQFDNTAYGIDAHADTVNIGLTNSSSVDATINLPTGASNNGKLSAIGINDSSQNTTVSLNDSQVSASTTIQDNATTGNVSVIGINDLTSISDTVNVTANSGVNATAIVDDNTVLGTGTVYGISQNQTGLSTGSVNISGDSNVNTNFNLGAFSSSMVIAAGIQTTDNAETITLDNGHMNSQMHFGDNQSAMSAENNNIKATSNNSVTISAANNSSMKSDFVIDNNDQSSTLLVNNISATAGSASVTVDITSSQLEANFEVKNEINPFGVVSPNNILISTGGSENVNVTDNSTLTVTGTIDNSESGTNNLVTTNNILIATGSSSAISIADSELNSTGTVNTVSAGSQDSIISTNLNSVGSNGGNVVNVTNSQLNVKGEMVDVQNGAISPSIAVVNIRLSTLAGGNTVNILQDSTLNSTATYDLLDGNSIAANMSVLSINTVSFGLGNNITISGDSTLTRLASVVTNNGATCHASLIGVQHVPADPGGMSSGTVTNCTTTTNVNFLP